MKINDLTITDIKKNFVYKYINEESDDIEVALVSEDRIPENSGYYLITGEATLTDGTKYPAIFGISSDDGGEMFEFYLFIDSLNWISNKENLPKILRKRKENVFPFRYRLNFKVDGDLHGGSQY